MHRRPRKCRHRWLCPTCAYSLAGERAKLLKRRLGDWISHGGAVALLTLTQEHDVADDLDVLWDRIEDGWDALVTGTGWRANRIHFGISGYVRVTEIVHAPQTGWNVHFHCVLFLAHHLDPNSLQALMDSLFRRYERGIARSGGRAGRYAQDLVLFERTELRHLAEYVFKGTTSYRKTGSRSPIAILDDLETIGEGIELWEEYVAASHGRRQVSPSNGLNELCGVVDDGGLRWAARGS
ncbi:protein rep [Mycolicibacterium phocaicum]|nr:protein rep [Mycolicibacterium sp.]UCZ59722.1 protein rep [Mycolicibacterium phocaicum]